MECGGEGGLDEGKALKYLVDINEIVEQLLDVVIGLRIIAWRKECKADKLEVFVSMSRWAWSAFFGRGTEVRIFNF